MYLNLSIIFTLMKCFFLTSKLKRHKSIKEEAFEL